jgi:hypothetical protein
MCEIACHSIGETPASRLLLDARMRRVSHGLCLSFALVACVASRADAGPFRRAAKVAMPAAALNSITSADGKTILTAEDATKIAAASLRASRKYGLPEHIALSVGEVARIAPNESRPVTGPGGFVVIHEARGASAMRYTTVVDGNGTAHDAGSGPLHVQEKLRSRLRFGSLLTPQNLTQASLTVGLGLLQIPNFLGSSAQAGTTALTGATLALLIGNTTKLFFDASKSHRDGVANAMGQSVQFIKDRQDPIARTPIYPTLAETYLFYKVKLEELAPGAVPISLPEFSEKIWANGF